jgi:hypothetical protein
MRLDAQGAGQVTVEELGVSLGAYPCSWSYLVSFWLDFDVSVYHPPERWGGSTSFTSSGDTLRIHRYNYIAQCTDTEDNTRIRYDWAYAIEQE